MGWWITQIVQTVFSLHLQSAATISATPAIDAGGYSKAQVNTRRSEYSTKRYSNVEQHTFPKVYPRVFIGSVILVLQVTCARHERPTLPKSASVSEVMGDAHRSRRWAHMPTAWHPKYLYPSPRVSSEVGCLRPGPKPLNLDGGSSTLGYMKQVGRRSGPLAFGPTCHPWALGCLSMVGPNRVGFGPLHCVWVKLYFLRKGFEWHFIGLTWLVGCAWHC